MSIPVKKVINIITYCIYQSDLTVDLMKAIIIQLTLSNSNSLKKSRQNSFLIYMF